MSHFGHSRPAPQKFRVVPHSAIDDLGQPVVSRFGEQFVGNLPTDCGSHSARWYVVNTHAGKEEQAHRELLNQDFSAFLPLVEVKDRRRAEIRKVPLFPRYLFVQFDQDAQPWRRIHSTRGVAKLFSYSPERPAPVPSGVVEALLKRSTIRQVVTDASAVMIAAGATVAVTDGPFADHRGVCLWSDDRRVRMLIEIMGGKREVTVARNMVEAVT